MTAAWSSSGDGVANMLKHTNTVLSKCPESKIILSGYSQGAEQVHGALQKLGASATKIGVSFENWGSGWD
jgi:cutinase